MYKVSYLFLVEFIKLLLDSIRLDILDQHRPTLLRFSQLLKRRGFLGDNGSSSERDSDSMDSIGKDLHHGGSRGNCNGREKTRTKTDDTRIITVWLGTRSGLEVTTKSLALYILPTKWGITYSMKVANCATQSNAAVIAGLATPF